MANRTTPEYRGKAAPLAKILGINVFLSIITLGFYRFWGKTRLRDYIWRHLRYLDEDFEYSGTGKELFIGFLIAFLVLAPLLILFNFLNTWLLTADPALQSALGSLQTVLFFFLFQFAIYRARRYRMSRTQWRGIRAGQAGAATQYAFIAMGYIFLTFVTLGLAYPWMQTALERYRITNTRFGNRTFSFEGTGSDLFVRWLAAWFLTPFTLGLSLLWYRAASLRYFTGHTRYEGLTFESDVTARRIAWLYLRYFASILVLLALIGVVVTMIGYGSSFAQIATDPIGIMEAMPAGVIITIVLVIIGLYVALNILATLFLTQGWIALFCRSLTITGDVDWDDIHQSALAAPSRGEGFADVLDVGGL